MSLPPALLQRLAQRGLVQKHKEVLAAATAENEEVIAEDYDELDSVDKDDSAEEEYQHPSLYDHDTIVRKRDDNFWLERMKARMGEGSSAAGYKGCPNKYNIYHKCTLYCVNRWEDGHKEPSREYMRRHKRMLRKYPLPKGWIEIYDSGCGVYYFANETDGVVSWLSPTHPKSVIGKSAAMFRRQLDESAGEEDESADESADERDSEEEEEEARDRRKSLRRSRSPPPKLNAQDFPSLHESLSAPPPMQHKQKSRDSERAPRQRREREHGEREHERYRGRSRKGDADILDPMDPSAYSDTPRGKWSDGLQPAEKKKKNEDDADEPRSKREKYSDDEDDDDY